MLIDDLKQVGKYLYLCPDCNRTWVTGWINFRVGRCRNCARPYIKELESVRTKATKEVGDALDDGKITRPENCELCDNGNGMIVGHHWNGYEKPLDIWWICQSCNVMLRGEKYHNGSVSKTEAAIVIASKLRKRVEFLEQWKEKKLEHQGQKS